MRYFYLSFFLCLGLFVYADDVDPWDNPDYDPGILLASDAEKFAYVKANISSQLDVVASNIVHEASEINNVIHVLQSEIQSMEDAVMNHPNDPYYQGMREAANRFSNAMYNLPFSEVQFDLALRNLNNSQQWLNRINFVPGSGDYTNVLNFIATNQWYFADTTTNQLFNVISNLTTIAKQVEDVFPDLHDMLLTILPDLADTWEYIVDFFDWATDVEDTFVGFFDLAYDRLEKPQADLQYALSEAWIESVNHFNDILKGARSNNLYRTYRPLFELRQYINSDRVQLSNEGWILAESLQAQTWSYWIEVEILNQLQKMQKENSSSSNNMDNAIQAELESIKTNLFLIMQHQTICQEPFYQMFNKTVFNQAREQFDPYNVTTFTALTNFILVAREGNYKNNSINIARKSYKMVESNWFNRVESLLLLQNGLIPVGDSLDTQSYDQENLDDETTDRRLRYATNAVYELVVSVSSLSNKLGRVLSEYKSYLDAFVLPSGQGGSSGGALVMLPELSLGGISVELGTLTWDDLSDVVEPVRVCSTVLWYFIFGFLSFKLVLVAVYLFGRLIAHVTLVISTLLS